MWRPIILNSEQYYQTHAQSFFDSTYHVDMSSLHALFYRYLPVGARVLDAGCGSGRDSKTFAEKGYQVEAFDASPTLAKLASKHAGISVQTLRFEEFVSEPHYDGIWCCASLLHLPYSQLSDTLRRLSNACKPQGIIYISFKYGDQERQAGEIHFTDLNEVRLKTLIHSVSELRLEKCWITADQRPDRDERWLNALLLKES